MPVNPILTICASAILALGGLFRCQGSQKQQTIDKLERVQSTPIPEIYRKLLDEPGTRPSMYAQIEGITASRFPILYNSRQVAMKRIDTYRVEMVERPEKNPFTLRLGKEWDSSIEWKTERKEEKTLVDSQTEFEGPLELTDISFTKKSRIARDVIRKLERAKKHRNLESGNQTVDVCKVIVHPSCYSTKVMQSHENDDFAGCLDDLVKSRENAGCWNCVNGCLEGCFDIGGDIDIFLQDSTKFTPSNGASVNVNIGNGNQTTRTLLGHRAYFHIIPLGERVYAWGKITLDKNTGELMLARTSDGPLPFFLR
mmetsp:Transcript_30325/g.73826  ORF Transcript_30325/g.73826 Transcript_30325/m.73826 type:complete len:312 (+) Transcript_30325:96-1031(+)